MREAAEQQPLVVQKPREAMRCGGLVAARPQLLAQPTKGPRVGSEMEQQMALRAERV